MGMTEAAETESQREQNTQLCSEAQLPGVTAETRFAGPGRSLNYTDLLHVSMFSSKSM